MVVFTCVILYILVLLYCLSFQFFADAQHFVSAVAVLQHFPKLEWNFELANVFFGLLSCCISQTGFVVESRIHGSLNYS